MSGNYCHFNDGRNDQTFSINLFSKDISLRQNPSSRAVGHGAVVWDASVIFSKYMEKNPTEFDLKKLRGKTVLELGSGCGLAGIGFMIRGASVTFTDMEMVVSSLTDRNVQNVYTQLKLEDGADSVLPPSVVAVDWTATERNPSLLESYDYILLTDCVFSSALVEPLIRTISWYMGGKTTVICCHEIRDEITNNLFLEELAKVCRVKKIPNNKMNTEYSNPFVEIIYGKPLRDKKGSDKASAEV